MCISLKSITIPPSLLHIGEFCFGGDERLSEVVFDSPSQLTSIGNGIFRDCPSLTFFSIPPRLQIVNGWSFYGSSIIDVEVDPDNHSFSMINSCLVNLVSHSIVRFFSGDSSAVIPGSIQQLGSYAFGANLSLTRVTIESPSIVVSFLSAAFRCCSSLESICIPSSVRLIDQDCFMLCSNLVSVTFESRSMLEIVGQNAFNSCESLVRIAIPASIQRIGRHCFLDCKSLNSIIFESPSNLSVLWELEVLGITSLEIPDSVEVIRGMTRSSREGGLVLSFGPESKLSAVYPRLGFRAGLGAIVGAAYPSPSPKEGSGAFVRYSEATLRKFRANIDYFATYAMSFRFDDLWK
jgi:hypothetical protein